MIIGFGPPVRPIEIDARDTMNGLGFMVVISRSQVLPA